MGHAEDCHIFIQTRRRERGNVVVYLLIAIALFGALSVLLSRQTSQSDGLSVRPENISLNADTIIHFAAATQGVIDQMYVAGSELSDLSFVNPTSGGFNSGSHIHKVYHPRGGGLNFTAVNPDIFTGVGTDPDPGWYIGRFNSFDWSPSIAPEVVLTAHQISQSVCAEINKKILGDPTIPALGGTGLIADYLIDDTEHTGTNANMTAAVCGACEDVISICVSNGAGTMWSFYSLIGVQ